MFSTVMQLALLKDLMGRLLDEIMSDNFRKDVIEIDMIDLKYMKLKNSFKYILMTLDAKLNEKRVES